MCDSKKAEPFSGITRLGRYRMRNGNFAVIDAHEDNSFPDHEWQGRIGPNGMFGAWSTFGRWTMKEHFLDIVAGPVDNEPAEMAGLTGWLSVKTYSDGSQQVFLYPSEEYARKEGGDVYTLALLPASAIVRPEPRTETGTRKVWLNIYPADMTEFGVFHYSKASADANRSPSRIACVEREITFVHGEGLGGDHG